MFHSELPTFPYSYIVGINVEKPPSNPDPEVFLWPDRVKGPWGITLHWDVIDDGRMDVVGVDVRSFPASDPPGSRVEPAGGWNQRMVTTSLLRDLKIAELIDQRRRWRIEILGSSQNLPPLGVDLVEQVFGRRRGGRPPLEDDFLQEVARVYSEAWTDKAHPTQAVREWGQVAYGTAAKWVMRARRRGFLGPAQAGKAGGVPIKPPSPKQRGRLPRKAK